MGAGGASTDGENGFGPPGSSRGAFSVGSAGAVVVVVVVVVEVSGAFSSSLAHPAVIMPIAAIALNPATTPSRRGKRLCVLITCPYLCTCTDNRQELPSIVP